MARPAAPGSSLTPSSSSADGATSESITMSTIHDMLQQVLAQTNALWQAQASTNRILDELRRSMPAPQESAEMDERLHRVEVLAETFAHSRGPPSSRATQSTPRFAPAPSASGERCEQAQTASPSLGQPIAHSAVSASPTNQPGAHASGALVTTSSPSIGKDGGRPSRSTSSIDVMAMHPVSAPTDDNEALAMESPMARHALDDPDVASVEESLTHTRVELEGRNEAMHDQLADLTGLVQQLLALYGEKMALMEQRWTERLRWKGEFSGQIQELMSVALRLLDEQLVAKQREEEEDDANEQDSKIKHRGLLDAITDLLRADRTKRHEEIINVVRATANEQVPFNVHGYLHEFSKALSTEVRMLLGEVGKLREERRNIQHELGYLLTMRSTFAPKGECDPDWPPEYTSPQAWPSPAGIPLPESPLPRPGWRTVSVSARESPHTPPPPSERRATSWTIWQPDPALTPTPPSVNPYLPMPDGGSPDYSDLVRHAMDPVSEVKTEEV